MFPNHHQEKLQRQKNKEPQIESPINILDIPEEEKENNNIDEEFNAVSIIPRSPEIETQKIESKFSSQKSIVSLKPATEMLEESPKKSVVGSVRDSISNIFDDSPAKNRGLIEEDLELFDGEFMGYTLKKKKDTPSLNSEKKNESQTPLMTTPIKLLLEKYSDQRKHSSPILDEGSKDQNLPDNNSSN